MCHRVSKSIVEKPQSVIILEDLSLQSMTKKAKTKVCPQSGRFLKNNKRQKSGLNKALLNSSLGQIKTFVHYKSARKGKILFLVDPKNTSRECADCGHTSSANRKTQAEFVCEHCGARKNADYNASLVTKKRAINLILHPGTGLAGAPSMPSRLVVNACHGRSPSKKARKRRTTKEKSLPQLQTASKKKRSVKGASLEPILEATLL